RFAFNREDLEEEVRLNNKFKNTPLYEILIQLSKEANLKFKQVNNTINVDKINGLNAHNGKIDIYLQAVTITGRVTSGEDGEALPGANVVIKGTSSGTVTDIEGNYSIEVPGSEATLVYSSVGFITEEIVVGSRSVVDITLMPD